ncbi:B12-binding domain-containing radical SAM protein [Tamlana sp. 2_MG-2023]|uniref:B12-binding domain-containing radical SAM protein n=1 Tax=unclassified Tamlana TaxID=2614803 RepID=UPI0026E46110|nr:MULTISPECIES: B12-binding domain-containing radical SAM protein [unclassified Tamlana]MDO6760151.1 B12-binding domain-containing radical SAM protein [Tamlana sp. 2_MG-2023]MDO6790151.1 B12-binding domain-containing radical SAM protein [Tamlana sp. 1_MG-2023]
MKDLLLITPPFTQLNTPYPATAYLKGFLNTKGISAYQMDLGIEVILELFKKETFEELFHLASQNNRIVSENCERIYALKDAYLKPLDQVIQFLQGKNQTLARQICTDNFLPRASRFNQLEDMDWAFGSMGFQDKAKHIATLYLEDLSDFIIECIDDNFGFSRYAERLGQSANSFDELYGHLQEHPTYIDQITIEILEKQIQSTNPKLICLSVPFPGNLYSAFRCAQFIKQHFPDIKTAMGGGFPNTELRSVTDVRVFEFFDFITLDDGELPIELLFQNISNTTNKNNDKLYKRTLLLENEKVTYKNNSLKPDYKQVDIGTPDYSDLLLDQYISVIEIANPMHSLWSDGRWNKLTMAHGCYWGKCTFCDISLDYIKIYEPITAKLLVDRMEQIIGQTNETGFHFVDEAAPPALMRALALEILKRKITVTWWANIRFEKNFTYDLCQLLKASGCIAVSGGLEVASDRLLKLIDKGVTVEQVAQVTRNFTESNIMVHSYLMYGYPTQTIQETVDSLEMVRQLFEIGIIQSGFWHQFALTAHSPIGLEPSNYHITPNYKAITFANNDVDFTDDTGIDHSIFSYGLKKSLFNFMHGIGFELPLQDWFDFKIPHTTIKHDFIYDCLEPTVDLKIKPRAKVVWLGTQPLVTWHTKTKKGYTNHNLKLNFHSQTEAFEIILQKDYGDWFIEILQKLTPQNEKTLTVSDLKKDFETHFEDFELFWFSKPITTLKENGLLVL